MTPKQKKSEPLVDAAPSSGSIRGLAAEFLGTAFLLCTVVGSGIMGKNLAGENIALALLANSIATGSALITLILVFAPISGAHFNPVVTLSAVMTKKIKPSKAFAYILVQLAGAFLGVWAAHLMFGLPVLMISQHVRTGEAQWLSEFIATFGLIMVIHGCKNYNTPIIAIAIGTYITAAYWFTSSTSFSNPAVTLARATSDTFAGIYPNGVFPFIIAQIFGAVAATLIFNWFDQETR